MGQHSKKRKELLSLLEMSRALEFDTRTSIQQIDAAIDAFNRGAGDAFDFSYAIRGGVRAFFAEIEGLTQRMRDIVLKPRNAKNLGLDTKTKAKLMEKRYDRESDSIGDQDQYLSFLDRLKLSFRYFTQLFGANFTLDTNDPIWLLLKNELLPARNCISHPGHLEDFYNLEAAQSLLSCQVWFSKNMISLLNSCGKAVDIDPQIGDLPDYTFDTSGFQRVADIVGEKSDFHEQIQAFQGRQIAYIREVRRLFHRELTKAINEIKAGSSDSLKGTRLGQFHLRQGLRTAVSCVEGAIAFARFFIEGAAKRGEIRVIDEEQEAIRKAGSNTLEKSILVHEAFSAHFGFGQRVEVDESTTQTMRSLIKRRDLLTHPKKPVDLEIDPTQALNSTVAVLSWQVAIMMELDAERLVDQGRASGSILD